MKSLLFLSLIVSSTLFAETCFPPKSYPVKDIVIVDGDTFKAKVTIWPGIFVEESFRLDGVDTPEKYSKDPLEREAALKAKEELKRLIELQDPLLGTYLIPLGRDKYGRMLTSLIVVVSKSESFDVSKKLIAGGFAVEYHGGTKVNWPTLLKERSK